MSKRGLGRGLSALMDEASGAVPPSSPPLDIPLARIDPHAGQPRKHFDEASLAELTDSIRQNGVLQPILVRPNRPDDGRYQIVAGERRWRAARAAGLHEIPALVRDLEDFAAAGFALIENVQRTDLNPMEEGEGYARLYYDHALPHDGIARMVGKSRSHVTNLIRLRDLPESVRDALRDGRLQMGHARALLGHADAEAIAQKAISGGWSVRQVEAATRKTVAAEPREPRGPRRDINIVALEKQIAEALGSRVRVVEGATPGAGEVTLAYSNLDQLDRITARLTAEERF